MFHIGQKVVCVDAELFPEFRDLFTQQAMDGLTKGAMYHVREVTVSPWSGRPAIKLHEIVRTDLRDSPYLAARFRPVIERKTDISVFTEILRELPTKTTA